VLCLLFFFSLHSDKSGSKCWILHSDKSGSKCWIMHYDLLGIKYKAASVVVEYKAPSVVVEYKAPSVVLESRLASTSGSLCRVLFVYINNYIHSYDFVHNLKLIFQALTKKSLNIIIQNEMNVLYGKHTLTFSTFWSQTEHAQEHKKEHR